MKINMCKIIRIPSLIVKDVLQQNRQEQNNSLGKNMPLIYPNFSWCNYIAIVKKLGNCSWKNCQRDSLYFIPVLHHLIHLG